MGLEFLKNSKCYDCNYLVSRVIKPHNLYALLKDMGIPVDDLDLDIDFDGEIVLEHYMCRLLEMELDHDVLECDGYCVKGRRNGLIQNRGILDSF